jgi:hypothetical protein
MKHIIKNAKNFFDSSYKDTNLNNPKCIDCNSCCGISVPISKQEKEKIEKFLATEKGKVIYEKAKENRLPPPYINSKIKSLLCPFSVENKCMIYDVRPEICMYYHCDPKLNKIKPQKGFEIFKYPEKYNFLCNLFGLTLMDLIFEKGD